MKQRLHNDRMGLLRLKMGDRTRLSTLRAVAQTPPEAPARLLRNPIGSSGFEGTSYNMFQDAAVFLAVAAGVMLHELRGRVIAGALAHGRVAEVTLTLAQLLLALPS